MNKTWNRKILPNLLTSWYTWKKYLCTLTISYLGSGVGFSPAQETRRNYHPLTKQEHLHTPLLMSGNAETLWSLSVSLLQSCALHRAPPHLFRLTSHLQLPGAGFLEGQWWAQQVGRDICFTAGQSVGCGQDTESLSFCRGPALVDPGNSKRERRWRGSGNNCLIKR